ICELGWTPLQQGKITHIPNRPLKDTNEAKTSRQAGDPIMDPINGHIERSHHKARQRLRLPSYCPPGVKRLEPRFSVQIGHQYAPCPPLGYLFTMEDKRWIFLPMNFSISWAASVIRW